MDLAEFSKEIRKRFPGEWGLANLKADDLLAAWWVFSQLSDESIADARSALTRPPDGGVDAVVVDARLKVVILVQSKFRTTSSHLESSKDFDYLTRWQHLLQQPELDFRQSLKGLSTVTRSLLRQARQAHVDDAYDLQFQFVTTGRASEVALSRQPAGFRFFGGNALLTRYDDYLAGVRPIPQMTLPVEPNYAKAAREGGIELGIYLCPGSAIRSAVHVHGPRLFARNVRGFQGDSNVVNRAIVRTAIEEPERFRYMNNGLTWVCDRSTVTEEAGKYTLELFNPQIVNGQQTSRSLGSLTSDEAGRVQVVAKVVTIDRDGPAADQYESVVLEVVRATNLQSRIQLADLMANDKRQVELARGLRRLGHYYARKSETAGESQRSAAGLPVVTRAQLGDAVGGCLFKSLPYRVQKDVLYTGAHYSEIFDPEHPERALICHYFWRYVARRLGGRKVPTVRNRAKWLCVFHLWKVLGPGLEANSAKFIDSAKASHRDPAIEAPLYAAIDATAGACANFYQYRVKKLGLPDDPTRFFKTSDLHPHFMSWMRLSAASRQRGSVTRSTTAFLTALMK